MAVALAAAPGIAEAQPSAVQPPGGNTLLGDLGGLRPVLEAQDTSLQLQATDDVLGNPNGGRARGVTLEGQTAATMTVDLEKAIDMKGGLFNVSGYQIYGPGLSINDIENLNLVSSIEARRSVWLYELWYDQEIRGGAVARRRPGVHDHELRQFVRQRGVWLAYGTIGRPARRRPVLFPRPPGVRLRVKPPGLFTVLLAAFNGAPAGPGLCNPERRDSSGTLFRVGDGVFAIGETECACSGGDSSGGSSCTLKLGGWYHDKARANQFFATDGLTSGSPAAPGSGLAHENWSAYAVTDVMLLPGATAGNGQAVFTRVAASSPLRSAVSLELTGGIVYNEPFGWSGDQIGLGITSISVGRPLGGGALSSQYAYRGHDTVLELSYQVQTLPYLMVQPDVQYVISPGGGIPSPSQPGRRVGSTARARPADHDDVLTARGPAPLRHATPASTP